MDGCVAVGLYRHAVTTENLEQRYIGWYDAPLVNAKRLEEEAHRYPQYDVVFTSDLVRCRETANALFPDTPIMESRLLREIHFGQWETKTYDELKHEKDYCNWLNDQSLPIPGGESLSEFEYRLDQFWSAMLSHSSELVEKYRKDHNGLRVALVTHGGVIRYFLTKWTADPKAFWEWKIPFAKGYEVGWTAEEWRRKTKCSSLREVPSTANQNG